MWWEGKKREKLREHIEKAWRGEETQRTGRDSSRANKRHPTAPVPDLQPPPRLIPQPWSHDRTALSRASTHLVTPGGPLSRITASLAPSPSQA